MAALLTIDGQMYDDRRAGARSCGCGRHAPVRVNLFHGRGLPEELGRDHIGSGPFGRLSGCVNTQLASINHTLRDCRLKSVAKGSEHSKSPSRYVPNVARGRDNEVPHTRVSGTPDDC